MVEPFSFKILPVIVVDDSVSMQENFSLKGGIYEA